MKCGGILGWWTILFNKQNDKKPKQSLANYCSKHAQCTATSAPKVTFSINAYLQPMGILTYSASTTLLETYKTFLL